jgi:Putative MetA-pathway of phenol degradation
MYVQPINLGWKWPRADLNAAYGLFMPTGRYEDGASNNTGLGQWAQEILVGTTVYMNSARTLHAATVATFDFQSEKKDSERKVGNILNLEGGMGADFLGGGLTAGLAYYGSFKLTNDQFGTMLPLTRIGKNTSGDWDPKSRWRLRRSRRLTASSRCAISGSLRRERQPRAPPGTSWSPSRSSPFASRNDDTPAPRVLSRRLRCRSFFRTARQATGTRGALLSPAAPAV